MARSHSMNQGGPSSLCNSLVYVPREIQWGFHYLLGLRPGTHGGSHKRQQAQHAQPLHARSALLTQLAALAVCLLAQPAQAHILMSWHESLLNKVCSKLKKHITLRIADAVLRAYTV